MSNFDWSKYKGNLKWLQKNTIFLTVFGSRAYNTNIPESDWDYRGIVLPDKEYFFGFQSHFEQVEIKDGVDVVIYDIRKMFQLAANANPNALEILFTHPDSWVSVSDLGKKIIDNRHLFLSQKVKHSMSGYAFAQLNRLKRHRNYLLNPVLVRPNRSEFGLDEFKFDKNQLDAVKALIQKKFDEFSWKELDDLSLP